LIWDLEIRVDASTTLGEIIKIRGFYLLDYNIPRNGGDGKWNWRTIRLSSVRLGTLDRGECRIGLPEKEEIYWDQMEGGPRESTVLSIISPSYDIITISEIDMRMIGSRSEYYS
jgi:hypothetical protein